MRKLAIVFGVAAIIVAMALAARESTVHVNPVAQADAPEAAKANGAPRLALPQIGVQPAATTAPAVARQLPSSPLPFFFVREPEATVAHETNTAQTHFKLAPGGLISADGRHYFYTHAGSLDTTIVSEFNSDTAAVADRFVQSGSWVLSGVSATGRWIALARIPTESEKQKRLASEQWKTEIQIVDVRDSRLAHSPKLDGNFDVDAISSDGSSLFLIQHLPALNPDHYQVRLYDLTTEQLQDGALVDKSAPDEVMAGLPWDAVASPDGQWLFTLYLRTPENQAFIHTLNLVDKFAICIDLPSGNQDLSLLKHFALALSPDHRTVYAVNPALGTLAIVDLNGFQVSRVESFTPEMNPSIGAQPSSPTTHSIASADGRTVFWSDGTAVWSYDTEKSAVRSYGQAAASVLGLYSAPDGKQLFLAGADGRIQLLDSASALASHTGW